MTVSAAAAFAVVMAAAVPQIPYAQAVPPIVSVGEGLLISPRRLVFGADGGHASLGLRSPAAAARFAVRIEDRVMLEDGRIVTLLEAAGAPAVQALKSAKALVEASPSIVALDRADAARVEVKVAAARSLAPGEYRTHLTIGAERPPEGAVTPEPRYNLWAYSIPVIVRVGAPDVRATISDLGLSQQTLSGPGGRPFAAEVLSLDLQRLGASSVFGDVVVSAQTAAGPVQLGRAESVAVYPEIAQRRLEIPLSRALAPGEAVTILVIDQDVAPGRILARVTTQIAAPARRAA
jgi:hypothetical protein